MDQSIKSVIQMMTQSGMPSLVVGIIENTNPISIVLKNDPEIQLSYVSLVIPKRISERRECPESGSCYQPESGLCRCRASPKPMQVGEELYMLCINRGKLYYVLDWV